MLRQEYDRLGLPQPETLDGVDVIEECIRLAARTANGPTLFYGVHVRNDNRTGAPPLVRLKAVCGPGDDAAPVVTIMLPEED